jgi:hypothetical protein
MISVRHLVLSLSLSLSVGMAHGAALENPKPGDPMSGIGTIYGWSCEAETVELQIDNGGRFSIPYGSARGDTNKACGDTDNGFVTQYNFGLLSNGEHRIRLYIDGVKKQDRTFEVTNLGKAYIRGLEGSTVVSQFPDKDHDITLTWSESAQNFQISKIEPAGNHPLADFNGLWRVENSAGNVLFQTTAGYRDSDPWLTLSMLDLDFNSLQIYSGLLEGSTAVVDDEYSAVDAAFEMELLSPDEMRMTVVHCLPSGSCNIRPGDVFRLLREEQVNQ